MDVPLEILYEDNHLLVVNKAAGLLTQPTEQTSDSLEARAKTWIKEKYQKPGNVFLGVVHRLDRPVSGIVVCAKTSKALSRLNASIRSKEMQKVYLALVQGQPKSSSATLEHFLKHDDHRAEICDSKDPQGKLARLHYKILKQYENMTLLEIVLETGRYHQIRCQCAAEGFPIVGDTKYGAKPDARLTDGQIALHHARLTLQHPITNTPITIEAPPPKIFP